MYELFVSAAWIDSEVRSCGRKIVYAFFAAASVGTSLAALATFLESCLGTRSETLSKPAASESTRPWLFARLFEHGLTRGVVAPGKVSL